MKSKCQKKKKEREANAWLPSTAYLWASVKEGNVGWPGGNRGYP